MAGQTKKGNARTGGRSMSKNTKTKNVKETEAYSETIYREVILWVMLAVSVVLFISNLGIGGTVGGILTSYRKFLLEQDSALAQFLKSAAIDAGKDLLDSGERHERRAVV